MMKKLLIACSLVLLAVPSFSQIKAKPYDFPDPVDTKSREIVYQEKKIYGEQEDGVFVRNDFPAARLNNFEKVGDNLYKVAIDPENSPINMSPWYAFKIWSASEKNIWVEFVYTNGRHRYIPKLSKDGEHWQPVSSRQFSFSTTGTALLNLDVSSDTLWVAAQEIIDWRRAGDWAKHLATDDRVSFGSAGQSAKGRDLYFLDINNGKTKKKDIIVVFSRQHPPEVTGFKAMQAFVDEMLANDRSAEFFKHYRIVVYPMLNPDGVDLGHWRHNTGGIDLNRDWAYYNQPETRQVADHLVNLVATSKSRVVIGFDFHSTQKDIFYTLPDEGPKSVVPNFKRAWLDGIEASVQQHDPNYKLNEGPSGIGQPVTKGWFYTQFGAEGVTYEVGDETPRDFIELKGRITAREMMRVLLEGR